MFGKLSLSAIPFNEPVTITAVGGAAASWAWSSWGWLPTTEQWTYLYREWLTSLDHKKIGIMYIILWH